MRDQLAQVVLPSVIGALLLFPPLAHLAFRAIRSGVPRAMRPAVLGCASLIAANWLAAWAGFGLPSRVADCYTDLAAYGAFCFLVMASRLARPRALSVALSLVGWTVFGLGFITATIGFLGLGWILEDLFGPSESVERVAPGLICETRSWGSAASASGYALHLSEIWPLGLRREVAVFSVMETEPADPGLSCAGAYERYRAASSYRPGVE